MGPGFEEQPEDAEVAALVFSRDGDSVMSAEHILRVPMEQCGCPAEVGVIFQVLVADDDKRAKFIQLSSRIFGEARMAMMQKVFRTSQGAGSDSGEDEEAWDDYGGSDYQFDPD